MDTFEELPALLVVLIAISLFTVSVAEATMTWNENQEWEMLQKDCKTFLKLLRCSELLCIPNSPGIFDQAKLSNISTNELAQTFNTSDLGFEYRISIQTMLNNVSLLFYSSAFPESGMVCTSHSCVNLDNQGRIGGARLVVSIWRGADGK